DDGSLPDLIEKLVYLTANGITKVISDGVFTNYTRFPESAVNDKTALAGGFSTVLRVGAL
ncbi:hypothetical protein KHU12_26010, partial [Pseudocitrobacter faecalis]|uniref:hypothetical protein n=1 Tax=Pseudocitrobacter faecalis TaxID=1398493 RepID=UPI003315E3DD